MIKEPKTMAESSNAIIRKIAKTLTSTLETEKILKMIMEFIGLVYMPENWSLFLRDEKTGELYFEIAVGNAGEELKGKRISEKGIIGYSLNQKEAIIIKDVYSDERFDPAMDKKTGFKTENLICIPLVIGEKALGAIELVNVEDSVFEDESIDFLNSLSDFAAIAINNANYVKKIEDLTIRDDCTCLYNSRHLLNVIDIEIEKSKKQKTPFSIVFLDLDHFKSINDTYGHLVGSGLLSKIGDTILESIDKKDTAVRYGGDEFVIIMTESGREEALKKTQKIHKKMNETLYYQKENFNIKVTASFGLATFPDDANDKEQIIKMADNAMYNVKKKGRNQIIQVTGKN